MKRYLMPFFVVLGGLGGCFLRPWQMQTAFEAGTGLPIPFAPANLALVALALVMLVGLAWGAKRLRVLEANPKPSLLLLIVSCCGALLYLNAARLFFARAKTLQWQASNSDHAMAQSPLLLMAFATLVFASALAILFLSLQRFGRKGTQLSFALLLPAFACCLWLMTTYQSIAGLPFISTYLCPLLAIMSCTLAHYFIAAHQFQRPWQGAVFFCCGFATFSALVSAGGNLASADGQLLLGHVLYFLATWLLLLQNDPAMLPVSELPVPEQHSQKEETT